MTKCCVSMCPNRSGKCGLTFHRFPFSRPDVVNKWLRNIGRKDFKPSKTSVVCSAHFEDHCFVRSITNLQCNLTKEAIPTLFFYPLEYQLQLEKGTILGPSKRIILSTQHLFSNYTTTSTSGSQTSLNSVAKVIRVPDNPFLKTFDVKKEKDSTESSSQPMKNVSATVSNSQMPSMSIKINGVRSLNYGNRIATLDYVPESANEEQMKFLKEEVGRYERRMKDYQKTLKSKQQSIRRLSKRIRTLSNRVDELEEASDLAKHAEKLVKEFFSGPALEVILGILKRKQKCVYPPTLKSFALTFYRHSPRAYNFVYSAFKGGLPKPNAVRRWNLEERRKREAGIEDAILKTATGSQSKENGDDSIRIQSENDNIQSSVSESDNFVSSQCRESESNASNTSEKCAEENSNRFAEENTNRFSEENNNRFSEENTSAFSEENTNTFSEENTNRLVTKKFSSDLDELIKSTLSNCPKENNNPEPKGYYVVHLKNPNSKKNSAVEPNNQETYNEDMCEEEDAVLTDNNVLLEVIVKTEQTQ